MKKISLLIVLFLTFTFSLMAQSVPQGMNYQAVARDHSGQVLANQDITLKVSLLSQNEREIQIESYSEIHNARTNKLGLFTLTIGQGTTTFGDFEEVPWSTEDIWMELAIDAQGGDNFKVLNNTRLLTVPYAFHAGTATEVTGDNSGDNGGSRASNKWEHSGNGNTDDTQDKLGTTNTEDLVIVTNNTERMRVTESGNVQITNELIVTGDVTANAYIGDGSALTGVHNTSTVLNGTTLEITDAAGTKTTDLSSLDESAEAAAAQSAADASQADIDTHIAADADTDASNELNTDMSLNGNSLSISDAGGSVSTNLSSFMDSKWLTNGAGNVYRNSGTFALGGPPTGTFFKFEIMGTNTDFTFFDLGENGEETLSAELKSLNGPQFRFSEDATGRTGDRAVTRALDPEVVLAGDEHQRRAAGRLDLVSGAIGGQEGDPGHGRC